MILSDCVEICEIRSIHHGVYDVRMCNCVYWRFTNFLCMCICNKLMGQIAISLNLDTARHFKFFFIGLHVQKIEPLLGRAFMG